jgi:hypothetical protein
MDGLIINLILRYIRCRAILHALIEIGQVRMESLPSSWAAVDPTMTG